MRRTSPKEDALPSQASWLAVRRKMEVAHAFCSSSSERRRKMQYFRRLATTAQEQGSKIA